MLTNKNKRVKLYPSDSVIELFYEALAKEDTKALRRVHIPKSDVFYVQKAIELRTGIRYTLDHIERAMYLEGMLDANDVYQPHMKRKYG